MRRMTSDAKRADPRKTLRQALGWKRAKEAPKVSLYRLGAAGIYLVVGCSTGYSTSLILITRDIVVGLHSIDRVGGPQNLFETQGDRFDSSGTEAGWTRMGLGVLDVSCRAESQDGHDAREAG